MDVDRLKSELTTESEDKQMTRDDHWILSQGTCKFPSRQEEELCICLGFHPLFLIVAVLLRKQGLPSTETNTVNTSPRARYTEYRRLRRQFLRARLPKGM